MKPQAVLSIGSDILKHLACPNPPYLRVLCADDSSDDVELLKRLLPPPRYKIDVVRTGQQARDIILLNEHDVYLIDLSLNGSDGIDLVKDCQQAGAKGPFIIWTGLTPLHPVRESPVPIVSKDGLINRTSDLINSIRGAIGSYRSPQTCNAA
jgi:CheY-like chemotaxis protein